MKKIVGLLLGLFFVSTAVYLFSAVFECLGILEKNSVITIVSFFVSFGSGFGFAFLGEILFGKIINNGKKSLGPI